GTRLVMTGSLLLLGLGAFATALVHELWQLYLTYGVVVSLAAAGPAPVSIAAIAARWFAPRPGLVVGIGTAGISAGQLSLVPVAMWLTVMLDWRASYIALAALLCLVTAPLVWLLLRDDPADRGLAPFGAEQPSVVGSSGRAQPAPERSARLADAFRSGPFWLLCGSYFICGYTTLGLIGTHIVPYAIEHGIGEMSAASALGLMGAVNILGAIAAGYVVDRYGRRVPLALTYGVR